MLKVCKERTGEELRNQVAVRIAVTQASKKKKPHMRRYKTLRITPGDRNGARVQTARPAETTQGPAHLPGTPWICCLKGKQSHFTV